MKVVMISGSFRGKNSWEIEQNVRKAEELALKVAELGAVAICIHSMYRFFAGTCTDEYWIEACKELLRRGDAVLFVDNWMDSTGAMGEKKLCQEIDKPYFYNLDKLGTWLREEDVLPE